MKTNTANASWVSKQPGRCGGNACIRDLRIPVWGLINYRRLGGGWGDILQAYPTLNEADLKVAWEYYQQNKDEIDQAIAENEEEDEEAVE